MTDTIEPSGRSTPCCAGCRHPTCSLLAAERADKCDAQRAHDDVFADLLNARDALVAMTAERDEMRARVVRAHEALADTAAELLAANAVLHRRAQAVEGAEARLDTLRSAMWRQNRRDSERATEDRQRIERERDAWRAVALGERERIAAWHEAKAARELAMFYADCDPALAKNTQTIVLGHTLYAAAIRALPAPEVKP